MQVNKHMQEVVTPQAEMKEVADVIYTIKLADACKCKFVKQYHVIIACTWIYFLTLLFIFGSYFCTS